LRTLTTFGLLCTGHHILTNVSRYVISMEKLITLF
jgi:hypothetical protein